MVTEAKLAEAGPLKERQPVPASASTRLIEQANRMTQDWSGKVRVCCFIDSFKL
jgi:hypothetical protein